MDVLLGNEATLFRVKLKQKLQPLEREHVHANNFYCTVWKRY